MSSRYRKIRSSSPSSSRSRSRSQSLWRSRSQSPSTICNHHRRSRSLKRSDKTRKIRSKRSGSSCNRHCCHRKSTSRFHRREFKDRLHRHTSNHSFKQFNRVRKPYNNSEDDRSEVRLRNDDTMSRCVRCHNERISKKRCEERKRHRSEIDTDSDTSNYGRSMAPRTQRPIHTCNRMTQTDDIITGIAGHHNATSVRRDTCTDGVTDYSSRDVTTSIYVGFTDSQSVDGNVETDIRKVKNNNPGWHCSGTTMDCKICTIIFKSWGDLVQHYGYIHPNYEVFPSRVSPQVADLLRNTAEVHECQKLKTENGRIKYKQKCYYCNEIKTLERYVWIDHLVMHSGYFKYRCVHCAINLKKDSDHVLSANCKIEMAPRTQFEGANVIAYLCDQCNFVRFDRTDIENHMQNEHGGYVKGSFKAVTFLRFAESNLDRTVACNSNGNQSYAIMPSPIKNNNPDWHWLSAGNTCKICGSCETSLTLHYVNMHPTSEVISSRIAPEIAAFLRSPEYVPDCEAVNRPRSQHRHYKQICFFCNELKVYTKTDWINHMIKHTGYYTKQCDHCLKKLSRDSRRHHQCDGIIQRIRHPQFDEIDLIAYVCNLCNFLRFDEKEIGKHLRNEHEHRGNDGMEAFEEIIFLTFSNHLLPRRNDCETPTLDVDRMELRKKDPKSWTVEEPVSSNEATSRCEDLCSE